MKKEKGGVNLSYKNIKKKKRKILNIIYLKLKEMSK